jgi:F-type H+-transporting ATPase subunit b
MNAVLLADILSDLGINPKVLAVQAFIFIVTFVVLKNLLFGRVMAHMKSREEEVKKQVDTIAHERAELGKLEKEYAAAIARIEKEAYDRLQAVLKEGMDARGKIVADAQKQASDEVKSALAAIAREKESALAALQDQVAALSRDSAQKVIEVPVDASAVDAAVRKGMS